MSAARVPGNSAKTQSLEEQIRLRAYLIFQERGGGHGHHVEDWLQAEAEIERSKPSAPPVRLMPVKKSRTKRTSI